ncbi:right-handed parallel beta-helix repeat-containing protein [Paenibacillus filicis]|uniref:Right-handed parallel beta-helix repeat-containing protein n=1 Tax=Paenibacillus filicis TaxID=669464 RepID=A0ABU9DQM9_9BACL
MRSDQGRAKESVELHLADYGGIPDTGEDTGPAMQRAIEAASQINGAVVLVCEPGQYDFYAASAIRKKYYISNTASEVENPNPEKTIGIYVKGLQDFVLDGGGSLFMFHGKHTMLVIDESQQIEIRNLHMDYAEPTVTEMTIEQAGPSYLDIRVHGDSRYELQDGKLFWTGEGWRFHEGPMQVCDPVRNTTWRIDNLIEQAVESEELEPGRIRLHYDHAPAVSAGWILQARDGIRDQVGAFIHRSRRVRLDNVGVHFMHGLGIVGQSSEDISFNRLELAPRAVTGRTVASFADFVHLSGCKGKISVTNSSFAGAHDDVINVHGIHLAIVGRPSNNQLVVRFMHHQTYGFAAFDPGDEVEFVRARSLIAYASSKVTASELISPREMLLTLAEPVPEGIEEGDVLENVTWTPEVEITDNYFVRIPTRGVLVTTRRKVLIARNVFDRMQMSAILVANDAASWYESGRVQDLTIQGNRFIECGSSGQAVIAITPENEEIDENSPVHSGIRIVENRFELTDQRLLDAKSTRDLTVSDNEVILLSVSTKPEDNKNGMRLIACTEVTPSLNRFNDLL